MYFDFPRPETGNPEKYCAAQISKVNPRAEKHGKEKKPAMDINLTLQMPVQEVQQFSLGDNPEYEKFFDSKGQIGNHGAVSIAFKREYENHSIGISFSAVDTLKQAHRFRLEKLKIKSIEFKHGRMVELKIQIQFHPNERDSGMLCFKGNSADECWINIRHEQADLATEAGKSDGKVTNIKSSKKKSETAEA